jgi:hypothetical protein
MGRQAILRILAGLEMSGIGCIVTRVLISEENHIRNSATDWESL